MYIKYAKCVHFSYLVEAITIISEMDDIMYLIL